MSAASVLARGRAAAQVLMVDTCTIRHQTGTTTSPLDGRTYPQYSTIYTGACRVQQALAQGSRVESGEVEPVLLRLEVQLPVVGSEGIARGDLVTIATCAHDGDLVGRVFRVRDLHHATHKTSRRIQCEEAT
ncbi:MAG: DUF6093 family protein [Actinomycetota bacterium]|nr:DUF6093 family protein [Actinomycetota bacterium]